MACARNDRGSLSRIRLSVVIAIVALSVLLIPTLIAGRPGLALQTGPTYEVLYAFTGGADGATPSAGAIIDPTRKLLVGTTIGGGAYGFGTVFGVNKEHETVLYSFTGGADGGLSVAGLFRDAAGNLYGTTPYGGNLSGCAGPYAGCGVVFKLTPTGQETVLYSFTGGADGANPYAGVIRDGSGNLYGTTPYGGSLSGCVPYGGCGAVFKLSPTGQETVHFFTGGADGANPYGGVIRDRAGNLYGTTLYGGNLVDCVDGCGVVFRLSPTGQETVLHRFTGPEYGGGADGANPREGVIRDAAGNFYGTTINGGAYGQGVVFELSSTGQEAVLHTFTGGADGAYPEGGVIRDAAGNLYGTTSGGGAYGYGVLFELSPTGQETVLYSFPGGVDGAYPLAGLFRDAAGNLYGTAGGGAYDQGVVFKLEP